MINPPHCAKYVLYCKSLLFRKNEKKICVIIGPHLMLLYGPLLVIPRQSLNFHYIVLVMIPPKNNSNLLVSLTIVQ